MNVVERRRLTAAVLQLLDDSFHAHQQGDKATSDRAIAQALKMDGDCVTAVYGGMRIGEIPNPEQEPQAWAEYVQAAQQAVHDAVLAGFTPAAGQADVDGLRWFQCRHCAVLFVGGPQKTVPVADERHACLNHEDRCASNPANR